jgi:hypothetical protein
MRYIPPKRWPLSELQQRNNPEYRGNISPPSSGSKNKPKKKSVEGGKMSRQPKLGAVSELQQCYNPADSTLHNHSRENLKPDLFGVC